MNRVAYYIRCSKSDQNPLLQIQDIDSICKTAHDIYEENQSAWAENVERPVFNSIIKLIKKGKLEHLYVWDLDRTFRNRSRLVDFFVLCKTYGCKIHSFRQNWMESINGIPSPWNEIVMDLLINIMGWMAQEESMKKSERVRLAVRRKKNGTFSHRGNKWGRKPLPKQTVDRIIELHNEGRSIREIAAMVTVYDKHKNEKRISKSAVHKIIVLKTQ